MYISRTISLPFLGVSDSQLLICKGWKDWSNRTTSVPKSVPRLLVEKVRLVRSLLLQDEILKKLVKYIWILRLVTMWGTYSWFTILSTYQRTGWRVTTVFKKQKVSKYSGNLNNGLVQYLNGHPMVVWIPDFFLALYCAGCPTELSFFKFILSLII